MNGTFRVRGVSAGLGSTKGDKDQVAVELEVLDEGPYKGRRVTWYGYFTEATTDRTLESLRTLGWQGDDLSDLSGIGSTEASAVMEEEEYAGKTRTKVQWINAAGGLALQTPMSEQQAKAFAARMKGAVVAHRNKSKTAGKPSTAASNRPSQADHDDIPF